jgi:hypothetical protein
MYRLLLTAAALLTLAATASAAESEEGFVSMFNGKDLTGWEGKEGWWYVEDGAITSQSTPEKPCKKCNYLLWRGGTPGDFEMRVDFKLVGGNSGVQFRSQERPDFDTFGYQADMDAAGQYIGCLYEHARGLVAQRGTKVVIAKDGKREVTPAGDAKELLSHVKQNDWNEYRIVAKGNDLTLEINGVVMCRAIDDQEDRAARSGIIGLQVHPGPPMKVQFKNLRIKELK